MAIESKFVFSDAKVARLPVLDKRYEVSDVGQKGLRLRVMPSGTKSFVWYYRDSGAARRVLTLGTFDSDSLGVDAARQLLSEAKKRHKAGEDPSGKRHDIPRNIAELAERFFVERILPKRERPEAVRQILDRYVIPVIGLIPLDESLVAPKVARPVESAINAGAKVYAAKVLAVVKQMFRFAEARGFIVRSPAQALKVDDFDIESKQRSRELTREEIADFWSRLSASQSLGVSITAGLKLLLLTGLRTNELRLAEWRYLDWGAQTYSVPVEHQKTRKKVGNPRPFVVPLPALAMQLLRELYGVNGASPYILASPKVSGEPIGDKALNRAVSRLYAGHDFGGRGNWTPHDFRRNLRSFLAANGFEFVVCEKSLNHSLGKIHSTYDQHDYLSERREALGLWGEHVEGLTGER